MAQIQNRIPDKYQVSKCVLINRPKIPPTPQNLSAQAKKFGVSIKKILLWASVVRVLSNTVHHFTTHTARNTQLRNLSPDRLMLISITYYPNCFKNKLRSSLVHNVAKTFIKCTLSPKIRCDFTIISTDTCFINVAHKIE